MRKFLVLILLLLVDTLSGCTVRHNNTQDYMGVGAGTGAVAGAVGGAFIDHNDPVGGALAGSLIGAAAGAASGAAVAEYSISEDIDELDDEFKANQEVIVGQDQEISGLRERLRHESADIKVNDNQARHLFIGERLGKAN